MSGEESAPPPSGVTITVRAGAYKVSGGVILIDGLTGETIAGADGEDVFLCRCGGSSRKPFCDGTHKKIGFDGTLTPPPPAETAP